MTAYAKVSLVKATFHPSDVAFAISWSNSAPGLGGWRVVLDDPTAPGLISVVPPGCEDPVFFISRGVGDALLERHPPGRERGKVGHFKGLREALIALCPVEDNTMEEIQLALERDFPRHRGR